MDNINNNDDFEVSFIFTRDELYTLILLFGEPTENGKIFMEKALNGTTQNNLQGLPDKKMAYIQNGKIMIEPVVLMLSAAICKADKLEIIDSNSEDGNGEKYIIFSPWVTVKCESYPKIDDCVKLTPLKSDI